MNIGCCLDCKNHEVINDPDPNDWFCDNDKAIVCKVTPNPKRNSLSKYKADHSIFRVVEPAIRPYNLRKEGNAPDWCPAKKQ